MSLKMTRTPVERVQSSDPSHPCPHRLVRRSSPVTPRPTLSSLRHHGQSGRCKERNKKKRDWEKEKLLHSLSELRLVPDGHMDPRRIALSCQKAWATINIYGSPLSEDSPLAGVANHLTDSAVFPANEY